MSCQWGDSHLPLRSRPCRTGWKSKGILFTRKKIIIEMSKLKSEKEIWKSKVKSWNEIWNIIFLCTSLWTPRVQPSSPSMTLVSTTSQISRSLIFSHIWCLFFTFFTLGEHFWGHWSSLIFSFFYFSLLEKVLSLWKVSICRVLAPWWNIFCMKNIIKTFLCKKL